MRAIGNGDKRVCAGNLLATVRGEVPYDRIRGVDGSHVDRPAGEAEAAVKQDAEWMLGVYEPRVKIDGIHVNLDGGPGSFRVTADIS